MTRIVRNWTPDPVTDAEPQMRDGDYNGDSGKQARENQPYKVGDVVMVLAGEKPKRARIIYIFSIYLEGRCYYIPKYRVQVETAAGFWSKSWVYVSPGDIERGFEAAKSNGEQP